ncbi:Clavaminate synthase-like protein [Corynespora cassiicola Philippines]|uniref:Clavaminate synthase-like protein n=1 Tax=Corynespora cassiicola Philippines TaxID=1448308 RepID=A0A2T2NLE8_CORCC|nr:Clavaminate synthase-like protein [Corynespora cassiicola Philippines]
MTTSFDSLPIVDVGALRSPHLSEEDRNSLSSQLYDVFATTGFAYLVNIPLSFDHEQVFGLAREFFALPTDQKMKLAKKTFRPGNSNTYRGYFPTQPNLASDNLKEGFEIGSPNFQTTDGSASKAQKIVLAEPNVWPEKESFNGREQLEQLHDELQDFSSKLLSLLASSLGKDGDAFSPWLKDSLSTLRLLHYPSVPQARAPSAGEDVKLSCTPHTDSGILTLLHQDPTGGLEVLNAAGDWVPAPYVPHSIVVNVGDLMAKVSGGRFTATMHRVRTPQKTSPEPGTPFGRFSIPFFFEPGERCLVAPVDGVEESVVYGEHVRKKMSTWVEFQDDSGYDTGNTEE